jgi:hypothetical protein
MSWTRGIRCLIYWIKLDLARLKLKDIPKARHIYFTFLDPRTDQDLSKLAQIFELVADLNLFRKNRKESKAIGPIPAAAQCWCGRLAQCACVAHNLVARLHGSPMVPAPRHDAFTWGTSTVALVALRRWWGAAGRWRLTVAEEGIWRWCSTRRRFSTEKQRWSSPVWYQG